MTLLIKSTAAALIAADVDRMLLGLTTAVYQPCS
jgi:hypothetical protein